MHDKAAEIVPKLLRSCFGSMYSLGETLCDGIAHFIQDPRQVILFPPIS